MDLHFKTRCHPEANGRLAQGDDLAWSPYFPLENGDVLHLHMGQRGRDIMFGMMIADCADSGEPEPQPQKIAREKCLALAIRLRGKVDKEQWAMISELLDLLKEARI